MISCYPGKTSGHFFLVFQELCAKETLKVGIFVWNAYTEKLPRRDSEGNGTDRIRDKKLSSYSPHHPAQVSRMPTIGIYAMGNKVVAWSTDNLYAMGKRNTGGEPRCLTGRFPDQDKSASDWCEDTD
jgi:hypothetical protein